MKLTVFLEGSPGHEKQSLAIVESLKEFTDLDVTRVQISKTSLWNRIVATLQYFLKSDGGCKYQVAGSDLLIGTGSSTHIPLLSCKKKFQIPVVTCMAPEALLRKRFDLCCIPRHDGISGAPNIILTNGPPVYKSKSVERVENVGLILLGGIDASSHTWDDNAIASYVSAIAHDSSNIQWRVSSSPRTPDRTIKCMGEIAKTHNNVSFFHYKDTPAGWVEEQYALASYAWVTADSMSMIYEAITAGCSVGVLPVEWKRPNNKFQKSLDHLIEKNFILPYEENRKLLIRNNIDALDEAAKCAREILARFA